MTFVLLLKGTEDERSTSTVKANDIASAHQRYALTVSSRADYAALDSARSWRILNASLRIEALKLRSLG